ncbi:MAG TPA: F0F1 ATP synthase subunit delta [Burkholderiaceae bacterium]|nr:F0F1 ATP synthase subunit delta [Burkholderiaceae bacterium]
MAELATIARPYAEALFNAAVETGADARDLADQLQALGQVAANHDLQQFAQDPKVTPQQVFDVVMGALTFVSLSPLAQNLLRTVIENDRLVALPEVAQRYHALVNEATGVSDVIIYSAFPLEPEQVPAVVANLERRFGRRLNATIAVDPDLIGGVRAVVGDAVFDASVKARLEKMKVALTA